MAVQRFKFFSILQVCVQGLKGPLGVRTSSLQTNRTAAAAATAAAASSAAATGVGSSLGAMVVASGGSLTDVWRADIPRRGHPLPSQQVCLVCQPESKSIGEPFPCSGNRSPVPYRMKGSKQRGRSHARCCLDDGCFLPLGHRKSCSEEGLTCCRTALRVTTLGPT